MQVSLSTFICVMRIFLKKDERSLIQIDFDGLRQVIFDAQSVGLITVAEGFAILEAVLAMVLPVSPFDDQKGPSADAGLSPQQPGTPVRGPGGDHD